MNALRFKQTFYNGGKMFAKSVIAGITGRRIPLFSTLYVTDTCNQRCAHCGIHTVNKKTREFTTQEWFRIIDDLCGMGSEWFRFLGGEPLLRKDLKELVDYVVLKKGKIAEILTNGIGIEDKMKELENLQFVGISMEGNKENYERVRGVGGFEKAIKAIECCVAAGKYVRVHMVINRYNIQKDSIDFMIDLCRKYRIQFDFGRLRINPYLDTSHIPEYYRIPDEMERDFYRTMLERKIKEDIPISNSTRSLKLLIDWPVNYDHYILYKDELKNAPQYRVPECTAGIYTFELSSDGKMRLCIDKYNDEVDIRDAGGIKGAWEKMANKGCHQCAHLSCIEQSLMFNVDPTSFFNVLKLLIKR